MHSHMLKKLLALYLLVIFSGLDLHVATVLAADEKAFAYQESHASTRKARKIVMQVMARYANLNDASRLPAEAEQRRAEVYAKRAEQVARQFPYPIASDKADQPSNSPTRCEPALVASSGNKPAPDPDFWDVLSEDGNDNTTNSHRCAGDSITG